MSKQQDAKASPENGLVTHTSVQTPEEIDQYWTEDRIRSAKPIPLPRLIQDDSSKMQEDNAKLVDDSEKEKEMSNLLKILKINQ